MFGNPLLLGDDGYQISRSVRLRSSASAYFGRTPGASSRTTWTYSAWVKIGQLSPSIGSIVLAAGQDGNNRAEIRVPYLSGAIDFLFDYTGATITGFLRTNQVFRDPSAWYHLVFVADTTQATASNRLRMYVNGVQVTSFNTATYPSQNGTGWVNSNTAHSIGGPGLSGYNYFDGYLTEVNFIDGQALTPASFGETDALTGVWKPKKYGGTYGTNGFYLNFSDNSAATAAAIGKDYSGNGNNWTPNNISVTAGATYDSMTDVPTNWGDRGNFAVLNPLVPVAASTLTNGNLTTSRTGTAGGHNRVSTMDVSSGRWYWEVVCTSVAANGVIGIFTESQVGSGADPAYAYVTNGQKSVGGTLSTYGASLASGDVVGVALDLTSGEITFYKNGTSQGVASTGVSGTFFPGVRHANAAGTGTYDFNFGQRPFAYTPPTGFKALNTQNIAAGSITTSGSFTGNSNADGPMVYLNGVPTAMTINGNAVTFGTHADKLANGFKVRTSSASYNTSGSNTYSVTTTGAKFKYANAQGNP